MNKIHKKFKLNGITYTNDSLLGWAHIHKSSDYYFEKDTAIFLLDWLNDSDQIKVQTSGTTGVPKIISVNKQAMINSASATGSFFNLQEGNLALCCLPVKYIAGKMMLVRAMILGLEIDLVEPVSNPLQNNSKSYDFVAMVPLQVEKTINKLSQIKTLLIGGSQLTNQLVKVLLEQNCNAYESYSMTETVTHIALKKIGESSFKALPNVRLSVDDRECLIVEALQITNQKLITNDIVELISTTEFIWKGRIDNVINSGGIKFFPEILEEKLRNKIEQRFFFWGVTDDKLGQKLILVIEGKPFQIDNSIFSTLERFEKPREIFFIPEFIETETGKIKRKETAELIN